MRRFEEFAVAFVNDARDRLETREAIAAPRELGGLGVERSEAEWMVALIAAVRDGGALPPRPTAKVRMQAPVGPPPAAGATPPPPSRPIRREEIFAQLAKEVVDEAKPAFSDPSLRPRLEALLVTRFRDVRDAVEVKAHMQRSAAEGGMGLVPAEADRLSKALEDRFSKIWKELHAQEKDRAVTGIKEEGAVREQKRQDERDIRQYADTVWFEERFQKKPAAPASKSPTPVASQEPAPPPAPVIGRSQAAPPQQPSPPPSPPSQGGEKSAPPKPSVQDVAYRPTLVGPIEELASLTLADFRRLGRDPKEASRKIQDKIRLLENEDYAQRAAAIAAWRISEPARVYRSLSRAMLEKGIGLNDALAAQGTGAGALTEDEYNAIMELQNSLRY